MILVAYRQKHPGIKGQKTLSWLDRVHDHQARTEYIFSHFFEQLFEFASRMVKSPADAEDIVMTVISRVAYSQKQPKTHDHLTRRLLVSVRNEAINWWRSRRIQQKAVWGISYLAKHSAYPSGYSSHQVKEKILQMMRAEIQQLPPQRRKVLHLYFFANKNTKQISAELSISVQTVLNHKAMALRDLRNSGLKEIWRSMVEP